MNTDPKVAIADIEAARARIAGAVRRTPLEVSPSLSARCGAPIRLKCEHHQVTGSFKIRGAANAVRRLGREARAAGVVAVSTGNHGRALAQAARAEGVRCVVCMSSLVPRNKIAAVEALGAEARIVGASQDEAQLEVDRLTAAGMTMIPPFDHPDVIAGQGTLGLELLEQLPEIETAITPVSGGGLVSGVAAALKARKPGVRVIGVSMRRGAAMRASLDAGAPVLVEERPTLADSLGGGVGLDNRLTFRMTRDLVDELVLVSEAEIAAGLRHVYFEERQVVEGAGAVAVAALLAGRVVPAGPTAALMCGANIDMRLHHRVISGEDVDLDHADYAAS